MRILPVGPEKRYTFGFLLESPNDAGKCRIMTAPNTDNIHVAGMQPLVTPHQLKHAIPADPPVAQTIAEGRETIAAVLEERDPRFLIICGPCSIHDPDRKSVV